MKMDIDAPTDDDEGRQIVVVILLQVCDAGFGLKRCLVIDVGRKIGIDYHRGSSQGRFRIPSYQRL
jgi:hypothetical protein